MGPVPPPHLAALRITEIAFLGNDLRLLFGLFLTRGPTSRLQIGRQLFALLPV